MKPWLKPYMNNVSSATQRPLFSVLWKCCQFGPTVWRPFAAHSWQGLLGVPKLSGQKNCPACCAHTLRLSLDKTEKAPKHIWAAKQHGAIHKQHWRHTSHTGQSTREPRGGTQATPHRCDAHGALRGHVPVRVMSRFLAAVGAHCALSPSYIRALLWKLWEFRTFFGGAAFRPSTLFSPPQLKSLFFGDPDQTVLLGPLLEYSLYSFVLFFSETLQRSVTFASCWGRGSRSRTLGTPEAEASP